MPGPEPPTYVCHWDGSFQQSGAAIGITIECAHAPTISIGVPVIAGDATRTESLGPPLLAVLLNLLPKGRAHLYGDSQAVVG